MMATTADRVKPTATVGTAVGGRKWIWLGGALIVGTIVVTLPTPVGLSPTAQYVLGIMVFTVLLWVFNVMDQGIASVLMMALLVLAGVRPGSALSGFSSPSFWILLPVLFYGLAMQSSGLARRLCYYILELFPATYAGILSAFFCIGFILAFGVPSMTVRTAILVPIAWALVGELGLKPRSRGAALILLSTVEMAIVPGCAFLYGSLFGPVVASLFQTTGFPLSWLGYAQVIAVPTLLLCGLLLVGNGLLLKPEAPLRVSPGFAKEQLAALGPLKRTEWIIAAVVLLSIAYWATDRFHHLPAFLVGMVALAVFALSGAISQRDVSAGVPWSLLLFLGGLISLTSVIQEQKISDWLAGFIVPVMQQLIWHPVPFVVAAAVAMFLVRFLDPSGFVSLTVLFLPMSSVSGAAGLPPLVLTAALVLAAMPFWLAYENFWIAMSDGMTGGQAFSPSQRLRLAHGYAVATIVALTISVGYWELVGIL
jgi:anion transporter